ncbi:MAG: hypothetical protein RR365_02360 [Bacteroides sp.]
MNKMKSCGMCKHCNPMNMCGGDCECGAQSDKKITFEVSQDDDIRFYGEPDKEPCKDYVAK